MKFFDFWLDFPRALFGLFYNNNSIAAEMQMYEQLSNTLKVILNYNKLGI